MNSLTFFAAQPISPSVGDTYYDENIKSVVTFNGYNWTIMASGFQGDEKIKLKNDLDDLKDYLKYKEMDISDFDDFITSKRIMEKLRGDQ